MAHSTTDVTQSRHKKPDKKNMIDSVSQENEQKRLKQPIPEQHQDQQPGMQVDMYPQPLEISADYRGSGKLEDKVALITGGDSGIGRAVALHFAREGANIAIVHLAESEDAAQAKKMIEDEGAECLVLQGDIGDPEFCRQCIQKVIKKYGHLDILVNNAAEQHEKNSIEKISPEQLERTFRTNIFSVFYLTQAAMEYLRPEASIINTTSVTAYRGSGHLMDYAATKGAIVSFTRSLAKSVADRGIRVNAVAPGPIWTPLIPSTFKPEDIPEFGRNTLMKRPGHPSEVAPSYVFLASSDASYITGQVLHPNGGEIYNA